MRGHRTVLFLFLFLCMTSSTYASEWTIGCSVINRTSSSASSTVRYYLDVMEETITFLELSDRQAFLLNERLQLAFDVAESKAIHQYVVHHDGNMPPESESTPLEKISEHTSVSLRMLALDEQFPEALFPFASDVTVLDYIARKASVDMLYVIILEPFDKFERIRIIAYAPSGNELDLLFDKISVPPLERTLFQSGVMHILSHLTGSSYGALEISASVAHAQFYIGDSQIQNYTFLPVGDYSITACADSFDQAVSEVNVRESETSNVYFNMKPTFQPPILLYSRQGAGVVTIDAEISYDLPLFLQNPIFPSIYKAEKTDWATHHGHIAQPGESITITFNPNWIQQSNLPLIAQDKAYASLGKVLLATGAAILMNNLSFAFDDPTYQIAMKPAIVAFGSYAVVETFSLIYRLFDYYRKSQYSSR